MGGCKLLASARLHLPLKLLFTNMIMLRVSLTLFKSSYVQFINGDPTRYLDAFRLATSQTSKQIDALILSITMIRHQIFRCSRHIRIAFLLFGGSNIGIQQASNRRLTFALQSSSRNTSSSSGSNPIQTSRFSFSSKLLSSSSSPVAEEIMPEDWSNQTMRKNALKNCIIPLSSSSHKGSSGRIGVLGGSAQYTGAPYYAAMASLKAGADLTFVFCAQEATIPIKSYSPELMVTSVYSAADFDQLVKNGEEKSESAEKLIADMVKEVTGFMEKLHVLVIGPGLGRCPVVLEATSRIIQEARSRNLALVLDADALYLLSLDPYQRIFQEELNSPVILTPNVMEFTRFQGMRDNWSNDCVIVEKGQYDTVQRAGLHRIVCGEKGGLKRPGGLGDVLSGTIGTLVAWNRILTKNDAASIEDLPLSCWTACCMVKRATYKAFEDHRRSMTAPDVLGCLGSVVNEMTIELDRSKI